MLYQILIIVQVLVAFSLIALVLLQQGKGADMGAAFGSGASGTVFGSRGSGSFLSRFTGILAAAFFINSLMLGMPAVIGVIKSEDEIDKQFAPAQVTPAVLENAPTELLVPAEGDLPDMPSAADAGLPLADLPPATGNDPVDGRAAP